MDTETAKVNEILLDTSYWIDLEKDENLLNQFRNYKDQYNLFLYFSVGNYLDLVRADEQEELARLIPELSDKYIPSQEFVDDRIGFTDDPVDLVPDPEERERFRKITYRGDQVGTFQLLFTLYDFHMPVYDEIHQVRGLIDEYGWNNALSLIFPDYVDVETNQLYLKEIPKTELILKLVAAARAEEAEPKENVTGEYRDILICSHALLTGVDYFLFEKKWIDRGVITRIAEFIEIDEIRVLSEFNELFAEID